MYGTGRLPEPNSRDPYYYDSHASVPYICTYICRCRQKYHVPYMHAQIHPAIWVVIKIMVPSWGTLNIRGRIIIGTKKGP